ncbi:hypothetical protein I3760_09G092000 [Carya illinoinensis]|nr:hypothetical protein I3760_09G092000 [Carya illinoinensis]
MGEYADQLRRSQIEVVIDANFINVTSLESHGHAIVDNVSKPPSSQPSILTRLHARYFRISLSLRAQALVWKILSEPATDSKTPQHVFRMLPSTAFLLLWCLSLLELPTLTPLYILRCFFDFPMVKAEFLHHIGVNFFYAPWISWLLLLQSTPLISPKNAAYQVLWFVFTVPVMVLDVKIYGQWFTTAVSVDGGESNEPDISVGEFGGGPSSSTDGMERECGFHVFFRHCTLFGALHYALPTPIWWQLLSGYAAAGFLPVLCCTKQGKFSLELHFRSF